MGPDRELDLSIHIALNPGGDVARVTAAHPRGLNSRDGLAWELSTNCVLYENWSNNRCWSNGGYPVPAVTESIDAAMTLVPKRWSRHLSEDDKNIWWVELRRGHATSYDSVIITKNQSLAIALCLASLKARLNTRTNEQDDARNQSGVSSE